VRGWGGGGRQHPGEGWGGGRGGREAITRDRGGGDTIFLVCLLWMILLLHRLFLLPLRLLLLSSFLLMLLPRWLRGYQEGVVEKIVKFYSIFGISLE